MHIININYTCRTCVKVLSIFNTLTYINFDVTFKPGKKKEKLGIFLVLGGD